MFSNFFRTKQNRRDRFISLILFSLRWWFSFCFFLEKNEQRKTKKKRISFRKSFENIWWNVLFCQKEITIEAGQELRGDVDETLTVEVRSARMNGWWFFILFSLVTLGQSGNFRHWTRHRTKISFHTRNEIFYFYLLGLYSERKSNDFVDGNSISYVLDCLGTRWLLRCPRWKSNAHLSECSRNVRTIETKSWFRENSWTSCRFFSFDFSSIRWNHRFRLWSPACLMLARVLSVECSSIGLLD